MLQFVQVTRWSYCLGFWLNYWNDVSWPQVWVHWSLFFSFLSVPVCCNSSRVGGPSGGGWAFCMWRCTALTDNNLTSTLYSYLLHPGWLGNPISACCAIQHSLLYGIFHRPSLYNSVPCCVISIILTMMEYFNVSIFNYFTQTLIECMHNGSTS